MHARMCTFSTAEIRGFDYLSEVLIATIIGC